MKNILLTAAAMSLLTGCSTTTPAIKDYTILPAKAVYSPSAPLASGSLRIAAAKTIPSLASKNIYYLREGGEAGKYLYSRWSDTPASLIERSLTSSLQERGVFGVLLSSASTAHPSYILESDLNAFYHRFHDDGTSEGYIDITYRLIESKNKNVIASKRFVITSPSLSADAEGGVTALTDATRRLCNESVLWLEMHLKS